MTGHLQNKVQYKVTKFHFVFFQFRSFYRFLFFYILFYFVENFEIAFYILDAVANTLLIPFSLIQTYIVDGQNTDLFMVMDVLSHE